MPIMNFDGDLREIWIFTDFTFSPNSFIDISIWGISSNVKPNFTQLFTYYVFLIFILCFRYFSIFQFQHCVMSKWMCRSLYVVAIMQYWNVCTTWKAIHCTLSNGTKVDANSIDTHRKRIRPWKHSTWTASMCWWVKSFVYKSTSDKWKLRCQTKWSESEETKRQDHFWCDKKICSAFDVRSRNVRILCLGIFAT